MPKQNQLFDTRLRWLAILGLWTGIGLLYAIQHYVYAASIENALTIGEALLLAMPEWYIWALLTPAIFMTAKVSVFTDKNWIQPLIYHTFLAGVFAIIHLVLVISINHIMQGEILTTVAFQAKLQRIFTIQFSANMLTYGVIMGAWYTLRYYEKFRERELRTVQLESKLIKANLETLQMQLQPHFLFNALNTISALVHIDANRADKMIARLSDLLRSTLESTSEQEVSLEREIALLRCYLDIEQARFQDRLIVDWQIEDENLLKKNVPNLILQPILENAIHYAIAPFSAGGKIVISASQRNNLLILSVTDSGPGLDENQDGQQIDPPNLSNLPVLDPVSNSQTENPKKRSIGLANTQARLQQLYGSNHIFQLTNTNPVGLKVTIGIPLNHLEDYKIPEGISHENFHQNAHR